MHAEWAGGGGDIAVVVPQHLELAAEWQLRVALMVNAQAALQINEPGRTLELAWEMQFERPQAQWRARTSPRAEKMRPS